MKINNKNFQDWTEEDLKVLLHNDAYRENNFIDYSGDSFVCVRRRNAAILYMV